MGEKTLKDAGFMGEASGTPISIRLDRDFRPFLWMCFKTMGIEPHDIQYEAANWVATGGDRIVFSCMREFGKTIIIASYICWKFDMDNNYMFVVQCANNDKAESIVNLVKNLLRNTKELQYMAPIKGQDTDNARRFNLRTKTSVTRESSITAYGSSTEITGAHVHEVIADDLETRENCLTDLRRERVLELVREYEDLLISDIEGCRVIIIGTPQTQESLYFVLASSGYEMFRLPSRYPSLDNEHLDTLAPFLLKRLLDKEDTYAVEWAPTYPERKSEEYLARKQMLQGDPRFYLQDLLDPSLSDDSIYPLKLANLMVYDSDLQYFPNKLRWSNRDAEKLTIPTPGIRGKDFFYEPVSISDNYTEFVDSVMWVDPSGSGSDECSWTVAMGIPGHIHVPAVEASVDAFDESTLKRIALTAKKYNVKTVYVEPNYGGGAYRRLLQPVFDRLKVPAALEDDKYASKQKEPKILDTLIPIFGLHALSISTDVARDAIWGYQITHLNYTKGSLPHDDRVESFWGAVSKLIHLVEETNLDDSIDHALERRKKAIMEYLGEDHFSDSSNDGPLSSYGLGSLGI